MDNIETALPSPLGIRISSSDASESVNEEYEGRRASLLNAWLTSFRSGRGFFRGVKIDETRLIKTLALIPLVVLVLLDFWATFSTAADDGMSGTGFDDPFSALSLSERWRWRKVIWLVVREKGGWQALQHNDAPPLGNHFYEVTFFPRFSRSVITLQVASSGSTVRETSNCSSKMRSTCGEEEGEELTQLR